MIPFPVSAGTVKAAGLALAVGAMLCMGFYGGYRWQSGNVAEAQLQASKAITERDRWQQNAQSYLAAIDAQKASNEAAIKAAEEQQQKAEQATREARAERDAYQRRLAQIEASIEHDKTDPSCKAELEREACGSPWR